MSDLIRLINAADLLAALWREGSLAALVMVERLVAMGFYAVRLVEPERGAASVVAWYNGVRFEL